MKRQLTFGLALCFGAALGCGDDTGSSNEPLLEAGVDGGDETSSGTGSTSRSSGSTATSNGTSSSSPTAADDGGTTSSPGDAGRDDGGESTVTGDAGDAGEIVWGDGGSLSISSPNFDDGAKLPNKYTCEGGEFGSGVAPELNWSGPAAGTKRYALVFVDITLVGVIPARAYHWVAYDIPVSVTGIPEELGGDPTPVELGGGTQVRGGPPQDDQNFFGPCPSWRLAVCPEGTARSNDQYNFVLYTFDDDDLEYPTVAEQDKSYPQTLAEFFEANATERAILSATSDAASTTAPAPCDLPVPDAGPDASDTNTSVDDAGSDASPEEADAGDAG